MNAKVWLVVKAKRSVYGPPNATTGKRHVDSIRVVKMAQNKPSIDDDEEAVEVTLNFPDDYFDNAPVRAEIVIPSNVPQTPKPSTTANIKPKAPSAAASVIQR